MDSSSSLLLQNKQSRAYRAKISGKAYKLRLKQTSQPSISAADYYNDLNKDHFTTRSESCIYQNNNCCKINMSNHKSTENQININNDFTKFHGESDTELCDYYSDDEPLNYCTYEKTTETKFNNNIKEKDINEDIKPKLKEINTEQHHHRHHHNYLENFVDNFQNYETIEPIMKDSKLDSPIGSQKSVLSDQINIEDVINEALGRRTSRFTINGEIDIEKQKKATGKRRYQIMTTCNCSDSESSTDPNDDDDSESDGSIHGEFLSTEYVPKMTEEEEEEEEKGVQYNERSKQKLSNPRQNIRDESFENKYNVTDIGKFFEPRVRDLTENNN